MTNNDLQNTTQKTDDRATRTPLKTDVELRCCGRVSSPAQLVAPVVLL
jgi:hypothetical protein